MKLTDPKLLSFYETHLFDQVMPFWTPLLDQECGGLNNCVDNTGTILSHDKYLWSQGRALWVFSALYNELGGDSRWLKYAENVANFIKAYNRCREGHWPFILNRDGSVKDPPMSIYVDAFMIYGLTEYARAVHDDEALQIALDTYRLTSPNLGDHTRLDTRPHPIPENLQSHGVWMIFALVYHDLGVVADDPEIRARALELAERIFTDHVKPGDELLYEMVSPGGHVTESDAGLTFVPGHSIESMWFMERIYRYHGREDRIRLAMNVMRWNLEKGWDGEFGGLYLACHRDGGPPAWHGPESKVWWPHTEALYGLICADAHVDAPWCGEWYERIHEYSFGHFPNLEHGDWHHYLDREGDPIANIIPGLQVKDPFHLPRALIYAISRLRDCRKKP
jgi:N-acylglucosamine 2-epimerase